MSTPEGRSAATTWIALLIGAVALALLVCFAVLLPKAEGSTSDSTGSQAKLVLPDTLPGDFTAADLPEAFTGQFADRADAEAKAQTQDRAYGDKVLAKVLGHPAVTRTYASKDLSKGMYVQAFRAAGGAFAPGTLPDPSQAQAGQQTQELVSVGRSACIVQSTTGQTDGSAALPAFVQCQRSAGELTVQVSSSAITPEDVSKVVDYVWGKVS